jgi:hypothetical protein
MRNHLTTTFTSIALLVVLLIVPVSLAAQGTKQRIESGRRYPRLVVRNALVIDGNATPASGPFDIVVENDTITEIVGLDPVTVKSGTRGARRRATWRSMRAENT